MDDTNSSSQAQPPHPGEEFAVPSLDPGWVTAVDTLEAADLLAAARAEQAFENQAEAVRLALAARWADLHAALTDADPLVGGAERLIRPGGDGTPEVAEFAPAELAAALGLSPGAGTQLVGDALAVRHRLPRLWGLVMAGLVPRWIAVRAAQETHHLTHAEALTVDERVAPRAAGHGWARLSKMIAAAAIAANPGKARAAAEAEPRGVWADKRPSNGTLGLWGRADAPDVEQLIDAVNQVAALLAATGDTGTLDERKARALGVIADPAGWQALADQADQMLHPEPDPQPGPEDPDGEDGSAGQDDGGAEPAEGAPGEAAGQLARCGRRLPAVGPRAVLYIHLSPQSIAQDSNWPVARAEQIGPVLAAQAKDWLGRRHVTITPVIDLNSIPPSDRYEAPPRLHDAVILRTPADAFPYSPDTSRRGDLDHTIPYIPTEHGGPPAQTSLANLARLTRLTHRLKTHAGWNLMQPHPGAFIWITPHHHVYLVDHTGTHHAGVIT